MMGLLGVAVIFVIAVRSHILNHYIFHRLAYGYHIKRLRPFGQSEDFGKSRGVEGFDDTAAESAGCGGEGDGFDLQSVVTEAVVGQPCGNGLFSRWDALPGSGRPSR